MVNGADLFTKTPWRAMISAERSIRRLVCVSSGQRLVDERRYRVTPNEGDPGLAGDLVAVQGAPGKTGPTGHDVVPAVPDGDARSSVSGSLSAPAWRIQTLCGRPRWEIVPTRRRRSAGQSGAVDAQFVPAHRRGLADGTATGRGRGTRSCDGSSTRCLDAGEALIEGVPVPLLEALRRRIRGEPRPGSDEHAGATASTPLRRRHPCLPGTTQLTTDAFQSQQMTSPITNHIVLDRPAGSGEAGSGLCLGPSSKSSPCPRCRPGGLDSEASASATSGPPWGSRRTRPRPAVATSGQPDSARFVSQ